MSTSIRTVSTQVCSAMSSLLSLRTVLFSTAIYTTDMQGPRASKPRQKKAESKRFDVSHRTKSVSLLLTGGHHQAHEEPGQSDQTDTGATYIAALYLLESFYCSANLFSPRLQVMFVPPKCRSLS